MGSSVKVGCWEPHLSGIAAVRRGRRDRMEAIVVSMPR